MNKKNEIIDDIHWCFRTGRIEEALRRLAYIDRRLKNLDLVVERYYRNNITSIMERYNKEKNLKP